MARSSSGVLTRCEPVPLMMTTFSAGTCASSAKIQGSRRSVGSGRVMSGMTIATRSCAATHSRSGLPPIGARTAAVKAAASSGSPGTKVGSITRTRADGISTSRPSRPYCR